MKLLVTTCLYRSTRRYSHFYPEPLFFRPGGTLSLLGGTLAGGSICTLWIQPHLIDNDGISGIFYPEVLAFSAHSPCGVRGKRCKPLYISWLVVIHTRRYSRITLAFSRVAKRAKGPILRGLLCVDFYPLALFSETRFVRRYQVLAVAGRADAKMAGVCESIQLRPCDFE